MMYTKVTEAANVEVLANPNSPLKKAAISDHALPFGSPIPLPTKGLTTIIEEPAMEPASTINTASIAPPMTADQSKEHPAAQGEDLEGEHQSQPEGDGLHVDQLTVALDPSFAEDIQSHVVDADQDVVMETEVEPAKSIAPPPMSDWQLQCLKLIHGVMGATLQSDQVPIFYDPVDTEVYPEYLSVVKTPICFLDIENRLQMGEYTSPEDCRADFDLLVANCTRFNKNTDRDWLVGLARRMKTEFNKKWKEMPCNSRPKRSRTARESGYISDPECWFRAPAAKRLCQKEISLVDSVPESPSVPESHIWHRLTDPTDQERLDLLQALLLVEDEAYHQDESVLDKVVGALSWELRVDAAGDIDITKETIRMLGREVFWTVYPLVCPQPKVVAANKPSTSRPVYHIEADSDCDSMDEDNWCY